MPERRGVTRGGHIRPQAWLREGRDKRDPFRCGSAMPLPSPAGLGIAIKPARTWLVALASRLTGGATLIVGPVGSIGPMAPHLARRLGLRSAGPNLAGAVLIGAPYLV